MTDPRRRDGMGPAVTCQFALGVNAPEPEVVQAPPVALPPTVPPKGAVLLPAQIVWLLPALAVGDVLIVTTTCAVAAVLQGAA